MTVFHLMRHGEHSLVHRALAGRMPGVGLSEHGRAEAAEIADRLAAGGLHPGRPSALYASPLQRTQETAEIVARRLDLPITTRDDLIELDFGEWTGATFDTVRQDSRWPRWSAQRSLASIPGGESMRAVQQRIADALIELYQMHREDTLVVVSHGDVIRSALVFALGMPLDFYGRIQVATGSISTVEIDDAGIRVICINDRPRLVPAAGS